MNPQYIAIDQDFGYQLEADTLEALTVKARNFVMHDQDEYEQFKTIEYKDGQILVEAKLDYVFDVYQKL